jgi:hypothetical protein
VTERELIWAHGRMTLREFDRRRLDESARFRRPETNTNDAPASESTSMPTDAELDAIERRVRIVG